MIKKVCSVLFIFITLLAFSCQEGPGKHIDKSNVTGNKPALMPVASILHQQDSFAAKENETTAVKPACCKGVPSRLRLNSGAKKSPAP